MSKHCEHALTWPKTRMGERCPLEPRLQTCTGPLCLLKSITPLLSLHFISCLLSDLQMFKNSKAVSFLDLMHLSGLFLLDLR